MIDAFQHFFESIDAFSMLIDDLYWELEEFLDNLFE